MNTQTAQTAEAALADIQELLSLLCGLLGEALPLALRQLQSGSVSAFDQWAFWFDFIKLEDYLEEVEPDYESLLMDYLGDDPKKASFDDLAVAIRQRLTTSADGHAD